MFSMFSASSLSTMVMELMTLGTFLCSTEMRGMVERDLPIERKNVTTDEASEYFARTGQEDRLRILNYRQYGHFTLYRIDGGPEDYFYGEMAPSTGYIDVFSLVPYGPGVVMMQPDIANPDHAAPFKDLPKLWRIYEETSSWNRILRCENAADLNEMSEGHVLREFIRVNEALQEGKIQDIARQFIASGARLILVAGPSSSGKTTFSHRLSIALRVLGLRPVKLSLDDYYRNRADLPLEPDGSVDLERIETLDTPLISEHLRRLMAGETVQVSTQPIDGRSKWTATLVGLRDGQVILGLEDGEVAIDPALIKKANVKGQISFK